LGRSWETITVIQARDRWNEEPFKRYGLAVLLKLEDALESPGTC